MDIIVDRTDTEQLHETVTEEATAQLYETVTQEVTEQENETDYESYDGSYDGSFDTETDLSDDGSVVDEEEFDSYPRFRWKQLLYLNYVIFVNYNYPADFFSTPFRLCTEHVSCPFQTAQRHRLPSQSKVPLDECSVCYEKLVYNQFALEVITLNCKHSFHTACLLPWMRTNRSCPNCRHEIGTVDVTEDIKVVFR